MKIEVSGVCYSYNSHPVLQDVNLQLEKGDIMGIVGPNGSGKSTLIKCLDRILKPQEGSIFLDSQELAGMKVNDIAQKMGYVPQGENCKFPVTVFDTVLMGRKPYLNWTPSSQDLEKVSEIIKVLNLEELAMREIGAISGGERQKVIIARALAQEPDIILFDEPTSSLDLRHQLEVLNLISEQSLNEITSIVAIHDLNMAARYCDKFVMLKEGMIYAAGGPEVLTSENIEAVYRVRVNAIENSGEMVIVPQMPV